MAARPIGGRKIKILRLGYIEGFSAMRCFIVSGHVQLLWVGEDAIKKVPGEGCYYGYGEKPGCQSDCTHDFIFYKVEN
jgi:hypothetical protein